MTYYAHYHSRKNPDDALRKLERLRILHPGDEELRERWLATRRRAGLPNFKIRAYLELWESTEEGEDPGEPEEMDLYSQPATFQEIIRAAEELNVQPDNIVGDSTWLSQWQDPEQYSHIVPQSIISNLDAIATALEVIYIDDRPLTEEDFSQIQDAIGNL